jgi:hypothetical protein
MMVERKVQLQAGKNYFLKKAGNTEDSKNRNRSPLPVKLKRDVRHLHLY